MTLIDLTPDDAPLIGEIIADAFADDPVNLWILKNKRAMRAHYTDLARYVYLRDGFGHRMPDNSGGTMWLPPGVHEKAGMMGMLTMMTHMIRFAGVEGLRRGMRFGNVVQPKHPREPHYYLHAIGVCPGRQGRGIGKQLMTPVLARADAEGMPCYLESSKEVNVAIYQTFGFEVVEEVEAVPGCPPIWTMWREGRG